MGRKPFLQRVKQNSHELPLTAIAKTLRLGTPVQINEIVYHLCDEISHLRQFDREHIVVVEPLIPFCAQLAFSERRPQGVRRWQMEQPCIVA
jgi:hypothetical protein